MSPKLCSHVVLCLVAIRFRLWIYSTYSKCIKRVKEFLLGLIQFISRIWVIEIRIRPCKTLTSSWEGGFGRSWVYCLDRGFQGVCFRHLGGSIRDLIWWRIGNPQSFGSTGEGVFRHSLSLSSLSLSLARTGDGSSPQMAKPWRFF